MGILRTFFLVLISISLSAQITENKEYPFPNYAVDFNTNNRCLSDVPISINGYLQVKFQFSGNNQYITGATNGVSNTASYLNVYSGKLGGAVGGLNAVIISGGSNLISGTWYTAKLEWHGKGNPIYLINNNDTIYTGTQSDTLLPTGSNYGVGQIYANNVFLAAGDHVIAEYEKGTKHINIQCVGNSNTAGYGLPASDAYPLKLDYKINQSHFNVVNAGASGQIVTQVMGKIRGGNYDVNLQLIERASNYMVLQIGINDVRQDKTNTYITDSLNAICQSWIDSAYKVVHLTIPYVHAGTSHTQEEADVFNDSVDIINTWTLSNSPATYKINTTPYLDTLTSAYQADGVHLSAIGTEWLADTLCNFFNSLTYDYYVDRIELCANHDTVYNVKTGVKLAVTGSPFESVKQTYYSYPETHGVSKYYYKGHSVYVPYLLSGTQISTTAINAAETVINYPATLWGRKYWIK